MEGGAVTVVAAAGIWTGVDTDWAAGGDVAGRAPAILDFAEIAAAPTSLVRGLLSPAVGRDAELL